MSAFDTSQLGLRLPLPVIGDVFQSLPYMMEYLGVIVPMGFINLVLSLQNLESAKAAGDDYPAAPALAFNGLGTFGAALFGSPFPTTIYIGHPGWKAIGARAGYSTLNAIIMTLICVSGALSLVVAAVPLEAGMSILIWIGIMMGTQAFRSTPPEHTPAVVVGLMPGIAAFAALIAKNCLAVAGAVGATSFFSEEVIQQLADIRNFYADGVFALEQGYVYTSIILSAATAAIIDRRFRVAGAWLLAGAAFSATGFIHTYAVTPFDIISVIKAEPTKWTFGYLAMAAVLFLVPWVTEVERDEEKLI